MCFHLKRKSREIVMEGREKWRKGWERKGGSRDVRERFRDSAYQIDESAVLDLLSLLWHHTSDYFWQVTSVASRRVVTFVYSTSWPYFQSHYRHLHAPGPRRHSVGGRSSVYSNCAGSTSPIQAQKSPIILITECLMTKMLPCPDWRRVLSDVWRWIFGQRVWRARY